ncbi:MAG: TIGR03435 family protein [Terracidiphilus sp.]
MLAFAVVCAGCAAGFVTAQSACAQAAPAPAAQTPAPAAAPSAAPNPKDIADTWQGTLHAGEHDLRTVVKITKNDKGGYKAVFYSIDQGGQPLPVDSITLDGATVKMKLNLISGTFEGKLSEDGKTIDGNWTQGPSPLPLTLARTTPDNAWPIPEPPKAMAADADPSLDVATIKPSNPTARGKGFGFQGTHFRTFNTNLNDLIAFAYGLHSKQIVGAPDWFGTELYDIDGVPDTPGRPNLKQMGVMVQKLLADRCALKFHHDTKELSVYAITVASSGPKMTKTTAAVNDPQGFGFRGLGDLIVRNMDMKDFATWMQSGVMDKPVVDQTGLKDRYDFTLKWTPDDSQFAQFRGAVNMPPPKADDPNAPPSLYTAVQETLGLKIEATKAPDDVIVIDHVEKPSAN